ncbi:MAG: HAD family hydrolase [Rickettsiales bacterium]|nr:HAD family hydrolase [Rickettsiales bacterium]
MTEKKLVIKNIFWDVDGVLANLNHAYYCFIKNHPKFKDEFKNIEYRDLPKALPIDTIKYGAMELSTHPTLGKDLDYEFCHSNDYYFDRPLYSGTAEILKEFNDLGYTQITMSAGFDIAKKKELLSRILKGLDFIKVEAVEHDKAGMHAGSSKEAKMLEILKNLGLKAEETVLVDDRIYNIYSAIKAGVHPVRFRSEFTTDSPDDLKNVPEVVNIYQFKEWLLNNTTRE